MSTGKKPEKDISILVVEDSKTQAAQISYFLESKNYSVHVCFDGKEAIEWLGKTQTKPDIVISDVVMPKMDGYELSRAIREDKELKEIPILLLTSLSNPSDIIKSIEAGANKFLTKPYDTQKFLQTIEELCENTEKRKVKNSADAVNLTFEGKEFFITADKPQILDLLISSYESAYYHNVQLQETRSELEKLNAELEKKVQERTKELRAQEKKFRTLAEHSPDLIIRFDKDLKLVYANRMTETTLGISCSSADSKSTDENGICSECMEIVSTLLKNGTETRAELKIATPAGIKYLDATFVPEFDDENKIEYVLKVARDITQQKHIETQLKEKEEIVISQSRQAAMGNMISMIAHQWRQPLTIMSMIHNNILLNMELGKEIEKPKLKDSMSRANEQIDYLNKTIEDFRNFFKPNHTKNMMSVPDVMDKSLGLIEKSLVNNNIKLTKEYKSEKEIMMFPNELMQVFINLINNAKDAITGNKVQDGLITLGVSEENGNIIAIVSDNAGGIPDEISSRIGEMNFTTKDEKGTGLGIYMSKMIVEKHLKGSLTWHNDKRGASFIVSIPIEEQR